MNVQPSEIRKGRKFDQVLDGARKVFMADGFEGASVDTIAKAAGVSKATLYSYFPDKRMLFIEVARRECGRQAQAAEATIDRSQPPAQVLRQAATHVVGFLLSDFGQRVFRISVAESDRFPELGRAFYESGPLVVRETLSAYLRQAMARGEVHVEDPEFAAEQFGELCKARLFTRMVFGVQTRFTKDEIAQVIDGAVDTFLARYGT